MDRLERLLSFIKGVFTADQVSITLSPVVTTTGKKILDARPGRKGLIIYNNSANSGYVSFGSPTNSNTNMSVIIATYAQFVLPLGFSGEVHAIRNGAGTGTFMCTEFF